jgi:hypothetical protein
MPHPLKPELLPLEQYLLPDLPTIVGNVDYQTLRAQLLRIHQLLVEPVPTADHLWAGAEDIC